MTASLPSAQVCLQMFYPGRFCRSQGEHRGEMDILDDREVGPEASCDWVMDGAGRVAF